MHLNSLYKHFVVRLPRTTNDAAYCYQHECHLLATVQRSVCITLGGRTDDNT